MKTRKLLHFVLTLSISIFTYHVFADVTKTIGGTGADYSTLKEVRIQSVII